MPKATKDAAIIEPLCCSCHIAISATAQCETCAQCEQCCECWECPSCDRRYDDNEACSCCDACQDCCDCWYCEGCQENQADGTSRCDYCEHCEQCCECDYCEQGRHRHTDGSCSHCDSCPDHCDCNESILPYGDDVLDYCGFHGTPHDQLWLGVELEVEAKTPGTSAEAWRKAANDWLICKSDDSLRHGFEIVTAPSDLPTHAEQWTKLLGDNELIDGLKSWDTQTCGMHVHISRAPLSQLTIGKVLVFMNSDTTKNSIVALAGRNSANWAKMSPKKVTDVTKSQESRYQAVNLQNSATLEFRVFKGTLNVKHVLANIQFTHAVVSYAKITSIQDIEDWTSFVAFVASDKAYKVLYAWLKDHNIL